MLLGLTPNRPRIPAPARVGVSTGLASSHGSEGLVEEATSCDREKALLLFESRFTLLGGGVGLEMYFPSFCNSAWVPVSEAPLEMTYMSVS